MNLYMTIEKCSNYPLSDIRNLSDTDITLGANNWTLLSKKMHEVMKTHKSNCKKHHKWIPLFLRHTIDDKTADRKQNVPPEKKNRIWILCIDIPNHYDKANKKEKPLLNIFFRTYLVNDIQLIYGLMMEQGKEGTGFFVTTRGFYPYTVMPFKPFNTNHTVEHTFHIILFRYHQSFLVEYLSNTEDMRPDLDRINSNTKQKCSFLFHHETTFYVMLHLKKA